MELMLNIDTGGEIMSDTISFFPEFTKMPNFSSRDMVIRDAADLSFANTTPKITLLIR